MLDGVESLNAAVDDRALIKRRNISLPVSPNNWEIRYDQRLAGYNYKGIYLFGVPRKDKSGEYRFSMRGSLIKLANNGSHNHDAKNPFEMLYAVDDLITTLGINPFRTPLNGLELSTTIPALNPKYVCKNVVSYLNHLPSFKMINRHGVLLPYVEIKLTQHCVKLYAPKVDTIRFEVKVDKMQYLGNRSPETLADLAQPQYADLLIAKLLSAFDRIIWKCLHLEVDDLPPDERDLYLKGRVPEYWIVRRSAYGTDTEFKRIEKQRNRQKSDYTDIVQRYWLDDDIPEKLAHRMRQQLETYQELMRSVPYGALLNICLERWYYVRNLPDVLRLPNRLRLPHLSEIYHLYLGKSPTSYLYYPTNCKSALTQHHNLMAGIHNQPQNNPGSLLTDDLFDKSSTQCKPKQTNNFLTNELSRLRKVMSTPGGLHWSTAELSSMLSARSLLSLACKKQTLNDLKQTSSPTHKLGPLFS